MLLGGSTELNQMISKSQLNKTALIETFFYHLLLATKNNTQIGNDFANRKATNYNVYSRRFRIEEVRSQTAQKIGQSNERFTPSSDKELRSRYGMATSTLRAGSKVTVGDCDSVEEPHDV